MIDEIKPPLYPRITHDRVIHFEKLLKEIESKPIKRELSYYGQVVKVGQMTKCNQKKLSAGEYIYNPLMGIVPCQHLDYLLEKKVITREEKRDKSIIWKVGPYVQNYAYWREATNELQKLKESRLYGESKRDEETDREFANDNLEVVFNEI